MRSFINRWWSFLFPVTGWKERYRAYKHGQLTWEVPGRPDVNKVTPWPVEWLPHRLDNLEDKWQKLGFQPIESTCVETGAKLAPGIGVRCVRCGVSLSPKAAHMRTLHDPPHCRRCSFIIALVP